ncbi:GHKL domain-containing protein [candidate division KSB1 bacterium]|nr:GHKL domain-containing protein [candidate division KSB1 bacterium]
MVFRNFRINCTLRIFFLFTLLLIFSFLVFNTELIAVMVILGLIIIFQICSLIEYVEKSNRDYVRFLEAIKYEDFSLSFSGKKLGKSFDELKTAFNDVLRKFQKTRAEKEEHHRYMQTVVQHIGIGLLSFETDGEVKLVNTAAKRLLKVNVLKNINSLKHGNPLLVETLFQLKPGDKKLVKIEKNGETQQVIIYGTEFILREQKYTLVSLQNIQTELEEKEMEAWQNLIRVLTHEIMNSITPIASLASTVNNLLADCQNDTQKCAQLESETIEDISSAAQTIEKRSKGLLNFVESYRKLTRIPRPDFQIFTISYLFSRIEQLMKTKMEEDKINFFSDIDPESLELTADPEMVEQVLINLLLNAIDAVKTKQKGKIKLLARMDSMGRVIIQVSDNGAGIIQSVLDKIFIPFFTTKQEGTGIGLSLSKQIMRLHRGNISVTSEPGVETVFTLRF